MFRFLTTVVCIGAIMACSAMASANQFRRGLPVKSGVLKSRAAVAKTFGKRVASQVPASFDFALFSLVWVDLPVDGNPRLEIHTIPADRALRLAHSSALWLEATRTRSHVVAKLVSDSPCSGGMVKPQAQLAACHRSLASSMTTAKQRLHLFATPRARLIRARASRQHAPPRP